MALYKSGQTGNIVFETMAKQRRKQREDVVFGPVDHSKKKYNRKRNFSI